MEQKSSFPCHADIPDPATALLLQATRTVYHFHYKNWPDHHVPSSIEPILELIRDIRCYQPDDRVPVCIHCRWVTWLPAGKGCWPSDPCAPMSRGVTGQGRRPSPQPSSSCRKRLGAKGSSEDSQHGQGAGKEAAAGQQQNHGIA